MKKQLRTVLVLTLFLVIAFVYSVSGQAPPPPSHGLNGNQTSPGTGCPIDRNDGIALALGVCLAYTGFILYRRGKKNKENPHPEV